MSAQPELACPAMPCGAPDGRGPEEVDTVDTGAVDTAPVLPSTLLDLAAWKLTLPVAEQDAPDEPAEIAQPDLGAFALDPWFHATETSVIFRANVGGVTTRGSSYPRSELREMTADGAERASWSTRAGRHEMTITQAVQALPEAKPHVVAGQIHDADDDVVMVRLEGRRLYVEARGEDVGELDPDYTLGETFTVRIVAEDGVVAVYYQDLVTPAVTHAVDTDGCYFKAGVYTQSSPERGDEPEAFGQVAIRALQIAHAP